MATRTCRRCGRQYRGLVCQVCHPRKAKAKAEAEAEDEVKADAKVESEAGTVTDD